MNKKILAVGLVACMACGMLAGCGGGDDAKDAEKNGGKVDKQIESNIDKEKGEKNTNKADKSVDNKAYEGLNITDANKNLGDIINYARVASDNETYIPILSNEQEGAKGAFEVLGINPEDVTEYALSVDVTNEEAYAVVVVKAAEGQEAKVTEGLQGFIDNKAEVLKDDTDRIDIVNTATVENVGDYIVMVMCKDSKDVASKIAEAINNPTVIEGVDSNRDSFPPEDNKDDVDSNNTSSDGSLDADLNNAIAPVDGGNEVNNANTNSGAIDTSGAPNTSDDWQ